jgi:hypothetical protein
VGRPNQFFRVGAGLPFKSTAEAVRVSCQRAALGRDSALAVLNAAVPACCAVRFHQILLPFCLLTLLFMTLEEMFFTKFQIIPIQP